MYDVIVIGAGPSGCTAAKILASGGYSVLLVEKIKLPRYKSCSGVLIKKSLDLVKLYITTFQTFNLGSIDLDYHYFYAYLQPELSEYDAWFNVKDNQLVLGVAVKDCGKIGFYYDRFIEYMQKNHGLRIDEQLKADKWIMPRIQPDFSIQYGIGRVLLAGEIAGFLNPMGEGISAGLESGFLAAGAVMEHFNEPDSVIRKYASSAGTLYNYMKRQWKLVGEMAGTFRNFALDC